jgi:hypothetical protein
MKTNLLKLTCGLALLGAAATAQAQYTYTTLDDPLGVNGTIAIGISGNNVVGYYNDSSGNNNGFLYNGSTWTTLNYPGAVGTVAIGISGNNVVGYYFVDSSSYAHGFLYDGSTWTTLDDPLGLATIAYGIDGDNIVGYYTDSSSGHGFLYDGSTWTTLNYPGAVGTVTIGISGNNVVGYYVDSSENIDGFEASIEPAPEPTTLALAGLGGLSLLLFRRRK